MELRVQAAVNMKWTKGCDGVMVSSVPGLFIVNPSSFSPQTHKVLMFWVTGEVIVNYSKKIWILGFRLKKKKETHYLGKQAQRNFWLYLQPYQSSDSKICK